MTAEHLASRADAARDARGTRDQRDLARAEQRGDRALRATHGLVGLLDQRPDLRGVYLPADLFDDSVRWCA